MDGSGVEPENDLCIFWRRILAYEWTDARWHEELRFFAKRLIVLGTYAAHNFRNTNGTGQE